MEVDEILEKYGLTQDNTAAYINAITRSNQTETAEELDVSRDTIHRYKKAFQEMTSVERLFLISSLAQDQLLQQASER
jgi:transcriptional regulator with XRE-family HTH domain